MNLIVLVKPMSSVYLNSQRRKQLSVVTVFCLSTLSVFSMGCRSQCVVTDQDQDGFTVEDGDCDDLQPLAFPNAPELCDGIDNNCDGEIDNDAGTQLFFDEDNDLYGDETQAIYSCFPVDGYTDTKGDCNDQDPFVNPGAYESCDGVDNNCDGVVDFVGEQLCTQSLNDSDGIFRSEETRAFGGQIGSVGDINGDGSLDIGIGAPNSLNRFGVEGYVHLFHSPRVGTFNAQQANVVIKGTIADSGGLRVVGGHPDVRNENMADFNGDGNADILIGSIENDTNGELAGGVYLLNGPFSSQIDLADHTASFWYGELAGSYAASSVSVLGDVNDDGRDDFVVGAYRFGAADARYGAAYIVFGPGDQGGSLGNADVVLYGDLQDNLGYETLSAGDVNGDGVLDIMINAYREESPDDVFNAGVTHLFYGPISRSLTLNDASASIHGFVEKSQSGSSSAAGGDIDGDGLGDLLIGTPFEAKGDNLDVGRLYVVTQTPQGNVSLEDAIANIGGVHPEESFARNSVGLYDINSDSYGDIAVSAKRSDISVVDGGSIHMFLGPLQGSLLSSDANGIFVGENAGGWAGVSLNAPGDINGEGTVDLLVGGSVNTDQDGKLGIGYMVYTEGIFFAQ